MFKIIKKTGKIVDAFELGIDDSCLDEFISQGRIKKISDNTYEVFSLEAINGNGEIAHSGDFVKVDSNGYPYPISRAFFKSNHKHLGCNKYEQIPKELVAWKFGEPTSEEITFLIDKKGLVIDENSFDKYFTAPLWGTVESAGKNAIIVFYNIMKDADGHIVDIDYNFVAFEEFKKTYDIIG